MVADRLYRSLTEAVLLEALVDTPAVLTHEPAPIRQDRSGKAGQ